MTTKEENFIRNYLKAPKEFSLKKLKGDASERQYYRICFPQGQPQSMILMVPARDKPKESQETYQNIRCHLAQCGLPVPHIYHYDSHSHYILLEDFGDILLYDIVKRSDRNAIYSLYQKAIDHIITMQSIASQNKNHCTAFTLAFDTEKLMWELNFFLTHVQKIIRPIKKDAIAYLRKILEEICAVLSNEPRFFTHRDYHSKNLMVKEGELKIIDFQDARLGPIQYDLVSLLKDSYAGLSIEDVSGLIKYYLEKKEKADGHSTNRDHFFHIFDLMTLQRSLKACGTFCYLSAEKNKKEYMEHFPLALEYARQSIIGKDEYKKLLHILDDYFLSYP